MKFDNQLINKLLNDFKTQSKTSAEAQEFIEAIYQGNNKINQRLLSQTSYFHHQWVETIAEHMHFLDHIAQNPRSFIKSEDLVVPVERAKKTTQESVRHLAANSHLIKEIDEDGFVIPEKILTIFREEDLATYENRFIKSLIDKLVIFIERRYQMMVKLSSTKFINRFGFESSFNLGDAEVDYSMSLNYKRNQVSNKKQAHNFEIIEKVEDLRKQIMGLRNTSFMQALAKSRPVHAPIQKTNILGKDLYYNKCYNLWGYLDHYESLDVGFELYESEYEFSQDELSNLYYFLLFGYNSIIENIDIESELLTEENRVDTKVVDALSINDNISLDEDLDYFSLDSFIVNEESLDDLLANIDHLSPEEQLRQLTILHGMQKDLKSTIKDTQTKLSSQQSLDEKISYVSSILKDKQKE